MKSLQLPCLRGRHLYAWLFFIIAVGHSTFAQYYRAIRLNDGDPIIDQATFTAVDPIYANDGKNINGPSVIRIPDWIATEDRAHPTAVYYCYFGDHNGQYIRMAWAADIEGPYTLYGMHPVDGGVSRGVLDLGPDRSMALGNNIEIRDHIASPDVHVDVFNQRIVLYFHGPAYFEGSGGAGLDQKTFVAYSKDGLNFNHSVQPASLGLAYFRVFSYKGQSYAIASRGNLYTAPSGDVHVPPPGFDYTSDYWTLEGDGYNDTPFQQDIDSDPERPARRLRHSAVRVNGDTLEVFHSRVGDVPERILFTTIDLSVGPVTDWDPVYPPSEVIWPERNWEGADRPLKASRGGAQTNARQLCDPYIFEDVDSKLYLFYCGEGEEAIGVAELKSSVSEPKGPVNTTGENVTQRVTGVTGKPALSASTTLVSTETKLHAISTEDGSFNRLIGVSQVTDVDSDGVYFFQDRDPGSVESALTGLSLTTVVPNASATCLFSPNQAVDQHSRFVLLEIGGNDSVTLVPVDAAGRGIGNYRLTISSYGNLLMTTSPPNKSSGGKASSPGELYGAVFSMKDFVGSGDLSDFAGFRMSTATGDVVLIAAILGEAG